MAAIFQRGKKKTWFIKYYVGGQQVYRSLRTTNARVAEQARRAVEGDQAKGDLLAPSRIPLASFLEEYCGFLASTSATRKAYSADVSLLRVFFGPICPALELGSCANRRRPARSAKRLADTMTHRHVQARHLEQVTPGMIEDFLSNRIRVDGIGPKSANRTREILHRMFAYAIRKRQFVSPDRRYPNPAAAVERRREATPVITWLTQEQIDQQLQVLAPHPGLRAIVAVLIYAGLRREEALWLTVDDVDLPRRLLHVRAKTAAGEYWQPKTGRNRVVPISTALAEILSGHTPRRTGAWYFPSPRGLRWNPDNFSQDLREINEAAGLKWTCLHFRHTFGSHLAQKGESLYKISTLMGNSPEICRRHYAALIPADMREEVEFGRPAAGQAQQATNEVIKELVAEIQRLRELQGDGASPLRLRLAQ